MKTFWKLISALVLSVFAGAQELPLHFDLRNVDGNNVVSSVKTQQGGTCWTHAVMAAMESNLMRCGNWPLSEPDTEPDLAEYHLDWWNGFNTFYNRDLGFETEQGLEVHYGGDYRVAAAYLSRGDGAVRDRDGQSFDSPPAYRDTSYHYYYPEKILWFRLNDDLSNIDVIKRQIMEHGAMGTCMFVGTEFLDDSTNGSFYQPPSDPHDPNHAIAIVGWNDTLETAAPMPGAWLCKNSWGENWGSTWNGKGYFWISYYDKHAGRHPEMGAVSFQNVGIMQYDTVYYHDSHGWRDTLDVSDAANIFIAEGRDTVKAVSFYTAADSVRAQIAIFQSQLRLESDDPSFTQNVFFNHSGFYTVQLDTPFVTAPEVTFIVAVHLDRSGHAYDRSSTVPVLLDIPAVYARTLQGGFVPSSAAPGQSLYEQNGEWYDLYELDNSANFCIKALVNRENVKVPHIQEERNYLRGIYPNPLRGDCWLDFDIPENGTVSIEIVALDGKTVKRISEREYAAGYHWIRSDLSGLSQGLYLCIFRYRAMVADVMKVIVFR